MKKRAILMANGSSDLIVAWSGFVLFSYFFPSLMGVAFLFHASRTATNYR
jgi:hypothetical protein